MTCRGSDQSQLHTRYSPLGYSVLYLLFHLNQPLEAEDFINFLFEFCYVLFILGGHSSSTWWFSGGHVCMVPEVNPRLAACKARAHFCWSLSTLTLPPPPYALSSASWTVTDQDYFPSGFVGENWGRFDDMVILPWWKDHSPKLNVNKTKHCSVFVLYDFTGKTNTNFQCIWKEGNFFACSAPWTGDNHPLLFNGLFYENLLFSLHGLL